MLGAFWTAVTASVAAAAGGLQAAADAGISLVYDGTALTDLGEVITISVGVALVLGIFYLVIRMLPSVRL
jgi:hypothetical protein